MGGSSRKDTARPDAKTQEESRAGQPAPAAGHHADPEQQVLEMLAGFEERLSELQRLWSEHRAAEARLLQREAEFAKREVELKEQVEAFEARVQQAELDRAEADRRREDLERRAAELASTAEAINTERAELEAAAARAEAERLEVEAQRRAAEEQARAEVERAEARQRELVERDRALNQQIEQERQELARREAALREAAEQAARAGQEATLARDAAAEREQAARAELKDMVAERDLLAAELERREQQQAEHHQRASGQQAELNNRAAKQAELAARLASLEAELQQRDADLGRARGELERLGVELKARRESGTAGEADAARLVEAERELAGRDEALRAVVERGESLGARVAELERELAEQRQAAAASQERGADPAEVASLRSELERTKAELALAVDTCDRAHAELKKVQARASRQTGAATGPAFARDAALLEVRRQRLARVKAMHRQQSNKIRVASEALRKRLEQCEQMIALRVELAQARQSLEMAHKRVQKQRGVGRVATALLSFAVMVALLGAMSWVVAGQMWPGRFVASATIEAQARGRELLPEERADWQKFHEELAQDPRFFERAAEALGKRGLASLSNPGELGSYLKAHMTSRSPGDGEICFELEGDGAERTARVLDTVVTTLAAEANAARAKRLDGGSTDIKVAATAGTTPVDDTRLRHALLLWGGATAAFLVGGIVIWTRLAAAKLRYEGQTQVEHALDEERWPAIPGLGPAKASGSPIPSTGGRAGSREAK